MSLISRLIDNIKNLFGIVSESSLREEDLRTMTKIELDEYAENEFGIYLDRRQTKENMINELRTKIKEKTNG